MAQIVNIQQTENFSQAVQQTLQLLEAGNLVALPTETVYVILGSGLHPQSIDSLLQLKPTKNANSALTLLIKGYEEALDYIPKMNAWGRKFALRCWPGPLTLAFDRSLVAESIQDLSQMTQDALIYEGNIYFRAIDHPFVQEILRHISIPLIFTAEDVEPTITKASQATEYFHDKVEMIVEDGDCRFAKPSTVIRILDSGWKIIKPGLVSEDHLKRLSSQLYLFVCTGNTCRSPLAAGLFRKLLTEKFQCSDSELPDYGYTVSSAGIAAAYGRLASSQSIEVARQQGVNLNDHSSQPLTAELLDQSDKIYTMTRTHYETILASRPDLSDRVHLLSAEGKDIVDPFGGSLEDYQCCEQDISRNLQLIVEQIPHET